MKLEPIRNPHAKVGQSGVQKKTKAEEKDEKGEEDINCRSHLSSEATIIHHDFTQQVSDREEGEGGGNTRESPLVSARPDDGETAAHARTHAQRPIHSIPGGRPRGNACGMPIASA